MDETPTPEPSLDLQTPFERNLNAFEDAPLNPAPVSSLPSNELGGWHAAFTDKENNGGKTPAAIGASKVDDNPQDFRDLSLNMHGLAALSGKPVEEIGQNYEQFKQQYVKDQNWDMPKTEAEFRSQLGKKVETQYNQSSALDEAKKQALADSEEDAGAGYSKNLLVRYAEWNTQHAGSFVGVPDTQKMQAWMQSYGPARHGLQSQYAGLAKQIVDNFINDDQDTDLGNKIKTATGVVNAALGGDSSNPNSESTIRQDKKTPEMQQHLASELAEVPAQDIPQVRNLIRSYAAHQNKGKDNSNVMYKMTQKMGRLFGNILPAAKDQMQLAAVSDMSSVAGIDASKELHKIRTRALLRTIANEDVNPLQGDNFSENVMLGVAGVAPIIAAYSFGPAVGNAFMFGEGMISFKDRQIVNNPDASLAAIEAKTDAFGTLSILPMMLGLGTVSRAFPATEAVINTLALDRPIFNQFLHASVGTAGATSSQVVEAFGDALFRGLNQDFSQDGSLIEDLKRSAMETPTSFVTMLIVGAAAHERLTPEQIESQIAYLRDPLSARVAGLDKNLLVGKTDAEIPATYRAAWKTRDVVAGEKFRQQLHELATNEQSDPTFPTFFTDQKTGEHVVKILDPINGNVHELTRTEDIGQANDVFAQASGIWRIHLLSSFGEEKRITENAARQGIDGINFHYNFSLHTGESNKLSGFENLDEEAKQRILRAELPDGSDAIKAMVEGWQKTHFLEDTQRFVSNITNAKGTPDVNRHESLDMWTDRILQSGRVTPEQFTSWVAATEAAVSARNGSPVVFMPNKVDPNRSEVIEGVTKAGMHLFGGHIADFEAYPADLKGYYMGLSSYFADVAELGLHVKSAVDAGEIPKEFSEYLANALGLPTEDRLAPKSAEILAEAANPHLEAAGQPTFSLGKGVEHAQKNSELAKEVMKKARELAKAGEDAEGHFFSEFWAKMVAKGGMNFKPTTENILKAVNKGLPDVLDWLKKNPQYQNYYHKDWELTNSLLKQAFPDITDDEFVGFRIITGLCSPSTKLAGNMKDAVQLMKLWKETGSLKSMEWEWSPKGNRKVKDGNPFNLEGTTGALKIFSLHGIDSLFSKLGSWQKVHDYLHEAVTSKELNAFNRELGFKGDVGDIGKIRKVVMEATGQDELIPRMFAFGSKVGAYTLNTTGDDRFTTTDIWEARFVRSHFPEMFKSGTGLPVNMDEHQLFQNFSRVFGEQFKKSTGLDLPPSALQAIRWFYMIESAKNAGYAHAKTDQSISGYTEAAIRQKLGDISGLDPRSGGQSNGASEAGDATFSIKDPAKLRDELDRIERESGSTIRIKSGSGEDTGRSPEDGGRGNLASITPEEFSRIAGANKASHKFGSSVDVQSPEDYKDHTLIVVEKDGGTFSIRSAEDRQRFQDELDRRVHSDPDVYTPIWESMRKKVSKVQSVIDAFARADARETNGTLEEKYREQGLIEINAVINSLPKDLRTKFTRDWKSPYSGEAGNIFTQYSALDNDKARTDFLIKTVRKAKQALDDTLVAEYSDRHQKLLEKAEPKFKAGKAPKGKLGADTHAILADIQRYSHMDLAEISTHSQNLEAEKAKLENGEGVYSDEERQARLDKLDAQIWLTDLHGGMSPTNEEGKVKTAELRRRDIDRMAASVEELKSIITEGRFDFNAERKARTAQTKAIRQQVLDIVNNGKKGTPTGLAVAEQRANGVIEPVTSQIDAMQRPTALFRQILKNSPLADRFVRRIYEATHTEADANVTFKKEAIDTLRKAWGKEDKPISRIAALRTIAKLSKMLNETGIMVYPNSVYTVRTVERGDIKKYEGLIPDREYDYLTHLLENDTKNKKGEWSIKKVDVHEITELGDKEELKLSPLQFVDALMASDQPDAQQKIERNGLTPEVVDQIRELVMKSGAGAVYDLARKSYDNYDRINAVFRRLYGVDLPRIENYSPLTFQTSDPDKIINMDEGQAGGASGQPSWSKSRGNFGGILRYDNAWAKLQNHIQNVNYWVSHAEMLRDFRGVFGDLGVLNAIGTNKADHKLFMQNFMKVMARDAQTTGNITSFNNALNKVWGGVLSVATLGGSVPTAVKHVTVATAPLLVMPFHEFLLSALKVGSMTSDRGAWFGKDSMIKDQSVKRFSDQSHAESGSDAIKAAKEFKSQLLTNVAIYGNEAGKLSMAGIHGTVNVSAAWSSAVRYDGAIREAKGLGITDPAAQHQYAQEKVDDMLHETMNPTFGIDKTISRWGSVGPDWIQMFAGPAQQRLAKVIDIVKSSGIDAGKETTAAGKAGVHLDHAARMVVGGWLAAGAVEWLIHAAYTYLAGSDKQKEEVLDWHDLVGTIAAGPLYGVPVVGPIFSTGIKAAITGHNPFFTSGNPFSDLVGANKRVWKHLMDDEMKGKDYAELVKSTSLAAGLVLSALFKKTLAAKALAAVGAWSNTGKAVAGVVENATE